MESDEKKKIGRPEAEPAASEAGAEVRCALCRGPIWPGEPYFHLEGRRVCEACLERYARRYFAAQRRRLGGKEQIEEV